MFSTPPSSIKMFKAWFKDRSFLLIDGFKVHSFSENDVSLRLEVVIIPDTVHCYVKDLNREQDTSNDANDVLENH